MLRGKLIVIKKNDKKQSNIILEGKRKGANKTSSWQKERSHDDESKN